MFLSIRLNRGLNQFFSSLDVKIKLNFVFEELINLNWLLKKGLKDLDEV